MAIVANSQRIEMRVDLESKQIAKRAAALGCASLTPDPIDLGKIPLKSFSSKQRLDLAISNLIASLKRVRATH